MIIFGWGGGRAKDFGPALPTDCPNCNNEVVLRYYTSTKWFSLFFIPVIPYNKRHLLICPICTWGLNLTPAQVPPARSLVASVAALQSGQLSADAFGQQVASFVNLLTPVAAGPPQVTAAAQAEPRQLPPAIPGPGWYDDPFGRHEQRYWNQAWTEHVQDGNVPSTDPPVSA